MSALLIFIIIVLVVLALVIWAIRSLPGEIDGTLKAILQVAAILLAAVAIAAKAGVF